MAEHKSRHRDRDDPVVVYKTILREVLDTRPSGTRQRLAEAIGKNRSFISQIANPAYPTPIPIEHVDRILELCHFSTSEKDAFLDAYRRAHPRRFKKVEDTLEHRKLQVTVPNLGDPELNKAFDKMVDDVVKRMARMMTDTLKK